MADRFDLVVVGSGPGGYQAAIRASQLGFRVAVVEKYATFGGTCLNVGCIPSKAMLDSSEWFREAQHGFAGHGIKVTGLTLDLETMLARKQRVVRQLTQGIAGLFKKNKITPVIGTARIAAAGKVVVTGSAGEEVLETERILLATGSKPTALPALPFDGERVINSTEALSLTKVPARLLVVGAGAIGLELGSVWSRLGAKVKVVEFLDRIVPMMDRGMGQQLLRILTKQGLEFQLETSATGVERTAGGVRVTLEKKDGTIAQEEADIVLVAIGRRPFTDGLGVREAGVQLDERGRINVNPHYETSVRGIWAIGDVIAGPMLAHKAEEEGIAAVERMAGLPGHVNYEAVPNVVYTWPEFASVGLTEEQCTEQGRAVNVGSFPFMANARAKCMDSTDGGAKVIADATTDRILGIHVLGPRASDLIAEAAVAMEFGASAEDIARSSHAHPTLPEVIKEAALAVAKRAINI
jgi:dihydrolipoamide dehydrogenase